MGAYLSRVQITTEVRSMRREALYRRVRGMDTRQNGTSWQEKEEFEETHANRLVARVLERTGKSKPRRVR